MLYRFAYFLMKWALRFFYRNVYVNGTAHIPGTGPVVLLANHASSVMDAILLGVFLQRPIHFFARGDMFKYPVAIWLMKKVHMMPVHHHQHGRATLQHNDETFAYAKELLQRGEMILFFPEGISHTDHHLLPFKKGVFRIAFEFLKEQQWLTPLHCVPIGITYDHPTHSGHCVTINAGPAFLLNHFRDAFEINEAAALLQASKRAHREMLPLLVHIENKDRVAESSTLYLMHAHSLAQPTRPWIQHDSTRFNFLKKVTQNINATEAESWASLSFQLSAYQKELHRYNITDAAIAAKKEAPVSPLKKWLMVAGFPLYITGWLLNSLPLIIAKRLADTKVYRMDFYSWIWLTGAALLYTIWLLLLFAGFFWVSPMAAIIIIPISLLSGWFYYYYGEEIKRMRQHHAWKKLPANAKTLLPAMRREILKSV